MSAAGVFALVARDPSTQPRERGGAAPDFFAGGSAADYTGLSVGRLAEVAPRRPENLKRPWGDKKLASVKSLADTIRSEADKFSPAGEADRFSPAEEASEEPDGWCRTKEEEPPPGFFEKPLQGTKEELGVATGGSDGRHLQRRATLAILAP